MNSKPSKDDFRLAVLAGWCWLVLLVLLLFFSCDVRIAKSFESRTVQSSVCRITNRLSGSSDVGSGTLVDKSEDGSEGLVLTCAHLFRDGVGQVVVTFAGGKSHLAKLVGYSQQADLAALAISKPAGEAVPVHFEVVAQNKLHACGYGPQGVYRCAVGPAIGKAESAGQMSLMVGDKVRSGDSGGGVFDSQGRLVAVIWGEAQGVTYASYGRPLREFLGRVLGRREEVVARCPNGRCAVGPPVVVREPQVLGSPSLPAKSDSASARRFDNLQKQIEELWAGKQDRGDYLVRGEVPDFSSYARQADVRRLEDDVATRHASLIERLQNRSNHSMGGAAGAAARGLLGLSGPAGWAVIVGTSLGGWLIGRRMQRVRRGEKRRGAGGRRRRRFRG